MSLAATCPSLQVNGLSDPLRMTPDNQVARPPRRSSCTSRTRRIVDNYTFVRTINEGSTATVYEARHNLTGQSVAIKRVKKSPSTRQVVTNERTVLANLHHPNVARLIDFEEAEEHYHIVQELCDGGDLFDAMTADPAAMTEAKAMDWMRGVLQGLVYLHECDIAHRDVKLENAALTAEGHVKLIDFGYAAVWNVQSKYTPGTEEYIAPELLTRPAPDTPAAAMGVNLKAADVWAAGILLFTLLTAPTNECDFPWARADDSSESFRAYRSTGELKRRPWAGFSNAARFLILNMLMCDPTQRCTAAEALAFINEHWPVRHSPCGTSAAGKPAYARASSADSTASTVVCSPAPPSPIAGDSGFDSDASATTVEEEGYDTDYTEVEVEAGVAGCGFAAADETPVHQPHKRARENDGEEEESDRRVKQCRSAA